MQCANTVGYLHLWTSACSSLKCNTKTALRKILTDKILALNTTKAESNVPTWNRYLQLQTPIFNSLHDLETKISLDKIWIDTLFLHKLRVRWPWFDSQQGQEISLYSTASTLAVAPTQPTIQWVLGVLSLGIKQPRHEANHSCPSSAKVKNCGAIPPLPHTYSWCGAKLIKNRKIWQHGMHIHTYGLKHAIP
jgi:hypothetical protein